MSVIFNNEKHCWHTVCCKIIIKLGVPKKIDSNPCKIFARNNVSVYFPWSPTDCCRQQR